MKKILRLLSGILILLVIVGVLGCSDNTSKPSKSAAPPENTTPAQTEPATNTESKPAVEIINDKFENKGSNRYVVGTVKNNTGTQFKFIQVEIDLYDQFGTLVESKVVTSKKLEPNGSWNFEILTTEKTAETYKFRDITRL